MYHFNRLYLLSRQERMLSLKLLLPAAGSVVLGLSRRFFRWLLKQLRIYCGIEFQRRVFCRARILTVLLVVAHEWNVQAVYRLPVIHVGFALYWSALAERAICLLQNVSTLRIDKPTDGSAVSIYVHDAGIGVADLLRSSRGEKHIRIFRVCGDEDGIALDLFQSLCFLRGREVAHALTWDRHECRCRRYHDVHCAVRSIHFRVQMIGEDDDGFHVHGKITLRGFLS